LSWLAGAAGVLVELLALVMVAVEEVLEVF
jgi:hypothetical protein